MSAENQEQDFEKLQRLLKLKRHEQPPPRFFNDFSSQVTARLRAGDVGKLESLSDVVAQSPWLQRFWRAIEGQPAVSGAFAVGACGLLLAGIIFADQGANSLPTFAETEPTIHEAVPATLFATAPGMALPGATGSAGASNSLFNGLPIQPNGLPIHHAIPVSVSPR
jgi:hypothetical protein